MSCLWLGTKGGLEPNMLKLWVIFQSFIPVTSLLFCYFLHLILVIKIISSLSQHNFSLLINLYEVWVKKNIQATIKTQFSKKLLVLGRTRFSCKFFWRLIASCSASIIDWSYSGSAEKSRAADRLYQIPPKRVKPVRRKRRSNIQLDHILRALQ